MNIHLLFKEILSDITAPEANYSLRIANRLYAEKTSQILPVSDLLLSPVKFCNPGGLARVGDQLMQ